MEADRSTLIGQVITAAAIIVVGGFIAYRIIQALAAFVDALQGQPEPPIEGEDEEEGK